METAMGRFITQLKNSPSCYLEDASSYLAEAADGAGWRGICIYASALLHYSLKRHFPDAQCDIVVGLAVETVDPGDVSMFPEEVLSMLPDAHTSAPYAHYWLQMGADICDCAQQSSILWVDPYDMVRDGILGDDTFQVAYHPIRRSPDRMPALFREDLAAIPGAHYFADEDFQAEADEEGFKRDIFGVTPEKLLVSSAGWRDGQIRKIVDASRGLLCFPRTIRNRNR